MSLSRILVNDTIHEALVYQILLKACAFLDEWNNIFGVHTEIGDRDKIISVKRAAKPAHRCISEWKNMRDFRNEAIAHNHRNKEGKNIYLNYLRYHSPQTNSEIYLLLFCMKKMMDVLNFFFSDLLGELVINKLKYNKVKAEKPMGNRAIKKRIKELDMEISNSLMHISVITATLNGMEGKTITVLP
jgi:hypothetical protein